MDGAPSVTLTELIPQQSRSLSAQSRYSIGQGRWKVRGARSEVVELVLRPHRAPGVRTSSQA